MLTTVMRPTASAPMFKAPSPVPVPMGIAYRMMEARAVVSLPSTRNASDVLEQTQMLKKTMLITQSMLLS